MRYAYIRVSTDKQTTETQRFEILKFADQNKLRNRSVDRRNGQRNAEGTGA